MNNINHFRNSRNYDYCDYYDNDNDFYSTSPFKPNIVYDGKYIHPSKRRCGYNGDGEFVGSYSLYLMYYSDLSLRYNMDPPLQPWEYSFSI